jgi:hypothetical protein
MHGPGGAEQKAGRLADFVQADRDFGASSHCFGGDYHKIVAHRIHLLAVVKPAQVGHSVGQQA